MKPTLVAAALLTAASAAAQARDVPVADPALIATEDARARLKYLAACALDPDTTLVGQHDGVDLRYPGAMGLAPDWTNRALTALERRWVSACILAHTNAFGANVMISMRAAPAPVPMLLADDAEIGTYTIPEGGYFGDIFADPPLAFACAPRGLPQDAAALERRKRVCALPLSEGADISQCGFEIVSPCAADAPPVMNGAPWLEVIHVWLDRAEPS